MPDRRIVVQFEFSGVPASRTFFRTMWLVLERSDVEVCAKNPGYPVDAVLRGDIARFVDVFLGHARWRDVVGKAILVEAASRVEDRLAAWLGLDPAGHRGSPVASSPDP